MENKGQIEKEIPSTKNLDLLELFPKILNVDKTNFKITSSEYIRELSLTSEERHKKLIYLANTCKIIDNNCPPQFKIFPHIVVFQRFEVRETYTLNLEVKNAGKVLLPLNMHCPKSEFFSARSLGNPMHKIAPGLSAEYLITFTPTEARDYRHHIVFKSSSCTFKVPIVAIGPRGMLDIPDQIFLNPAGVKIPNNKFLVIRNIGNAPAVFSFITKSENFQISPQKGILPIHETIVINISCYLSKVGQVSEVIILALETGEKLNITLHGSAETLGVRLDKSTVVHDDTYVGLTRCKTVRLTNNSSHIVKFSWKQHKSSEEELKIAESLKEKYTEIAELEVFKDAEVTYHGLSNSKLHKLSCERILKDELKILEKEEFKFSNPNFTIMPESGDVWPKSAVEIMTSFEPKSPGMALAEAYLEVTGRESRLPLRLKGFGMGPNIILNVKILDINYIYLCSFHKYEVVAENKGSIGGTLEFKASPLIFGGKIEVHPLSRFLKPKECAAFIVSFTSNRQGEFTETITFVIKESGEKVDFVLKGKIVCPTLHFDKKNLNFGAVSFGFPSSQEVTLNNLSMVPVSFSVRILGDGEEPSISYEQFANFTVKPSIPASPKEFRIEPEQSVVESFSYKKVKVTLTPNRVGIFSLKLVADMWNSTSSSITCPIQFYCVIPELKIEPEKIIIPFCFINFPYTRTFTVRNLSKVNGFFFLSPSDSNFEMTTHSANIPQGVVEAQGSIKVDITLITSILGRQIISIRLLTFGEKSPREACLISCIGQGPVLSFNQLFINWGELQLLQESTKTLTIFNESPIPANVEVSLRSRNSLWKVNPTCFTIKPEKSIDVSVTLFLCDPGIFREVLKITVHNGKVQNMTLIANGVGSSLITQPIISPRYDLGTLYSYKKYNFEIQISNKGSKHYGLIWSVTPEYRNIAERLGAKDLPFKILPNKFDIPPKETKTITVEVYGTSAGYYQQTFYCFSKKETHNREPFLISEMFAQFVEPLINLDKDEINFWLNVGAHGVDAKLQETVTITNNSVLSTTLCLRVLTPFSLYLEDKECSSCEVILEGNKSVEILIKFEVESNEDRSSKTFNETLSVSIKDYSKKIFLSLKGEINYPNVKAFPKHIDFQIPLGATAYSEVCLVNLSPLTVWYEVSWDVLTCELMAYEKSETAYKNCTSAVKQEEKCEWFESEQLSEEKYLDENDEKKEVLITPEPSTSKVPEITITKSDIKKALFPLARNYYTCEEELLQVYKMTRSSDTEVVDSLPLYTKLCDVTPFYGKLDPFASQNLAIKFFGKYPGKAHLEALIEVLSGPTEVIKIDANIGKIDYHLSECELDFGKQLFCETKSQILKLQNAGPVPFFFEVYTSNSQICELNDVFPIGMGALTVTPHSGKVDPFSMVELIVRYHPGVPGKFKDTFQIQVGYLDPVFVKVKGFGVFPQVYLLLPRPEVNDVSPEIEYTAVGNLTPDWMLTGYFTNIPLRESCYEKPYRSRESNLENLLDTELEEQEWEVIQYSESMPSNIDINLAIERTLAFNLVSQKSSNIATFAVYARTIPEFRVPAYKLDFGVCLISRMVEQNVTVQNFGPLPVVLYGIYEPRLKQDGVLIRLKNRNEIKVGACLPFVVSFLPKKRRFKKKIQTLETFFYFEIYHGPKIPIKINAIVTYPHVIASTHAMNFGQLICGCCKVTTLKLKNPGLVEANWTLNFTKKKNADLTEVADRRSTFYSDITSGSLTPGEYCSVKIFFQPKSGGVFSSTMVIHVVLGLQEVLIPLAGEAFEPKLILSQNCLDFGSTLPFPNKVEQTFVITNPCEFPIEFYFPKIDDQIFEEDKILRAIMLYNQTEEIYLPTRGPGDGLPIELITFYNMLLNDLNAQYIAKEQEKNLALAEADKENQDDSALILSGEDDTVFPEKMKKNFNEPFLRSQTNAEFERELSNTFDDTKESTVQSIFNAKTSLEIDEMLHEHILSLTNREPLFDPIRASIRSSLPSLEEKEYTPGTLIIFYGAPFTNCLLWANRIAQHADLISLNIDRIVLEEAALGRSEAGRAAKEIIEQAYRNSTKDDKKETVAELEEEEEEEEDALKQDHMKDFEEIQRKFDTLVNLRENSMHQSKNLGSASVKSGKSDGSKKQEREISVAKGWSASVVNIPENLIFEILKFRFSLEVVPGLIIENLHSLLITSSMKALEMVLKAAGNLKDIICIFFLNTYEKYGEYIKKKEAEKESARLNERKEILRIVEEETQEVFDALNLNAEDARSVKEEYLSQRRESHELFKEKRKKFYEMEKLKGEYKKTCLNFPLLPFKKRVDTADASEKKEKDKKKEPVKGAKMSDISGRKTESDAPSNLAVKFQKDPTEIAFMTFEKEYEEMKNLIEAWDQRKGGPVQTEPPPEGKLKRGQTPRKPEPVPVAKPQNNPGRGVFLWLVDVSNPDNNSLPGVSCFLKASVGAQTPEESDSWPLENIESIVLTVVPYPPLRKRGFDVNSFTIKMCDSCSVEGENSFDEMGGSHSPTATKLNRSQSSISFKSKRRSSALTKRRKTESRMSIDVKSQKSNLQVEEEYQCKSRCILQPGEKASYCVKFFPTQTGIWRQSICINLVTWIHGCAVHCIGICDIPKLDMTPQVIFPQKIPAKSAGPTEASTPFCSEKTYDFGAVILLNDERKNTERKTVFAFANPTTLPVELRVILFHDSNGNEAGDSSCVKFTPDKFHLKPGQKEEITVIMKPTKIGPITETLMLLVKDNPKIELIQLKCEGITPKITVEPEMVNFDRLLLRRKISYPLLLRNNNKVPLYISLKRIEELPKQLSFSQTKGWISPLDTMTIDVQYMATEVQVINEQAVDIKVYDDMNADEPVQELSFKVSVEAYDAEVDIIFERKQDDHLDFGDMRVENDCTYIFNVKNQGKYPLGYKIDMDYQILAESQNDNFFINPAQGIISPGKCFPLSVNFMARNEVNWKRVPLLKLLLVEPNNADELIATIPINVSARSHFAKYEIKPEDYFSFGHIPVGSLKEGSLMIKNKGYFSLSYTVETLNKHTSPAASEEALKKSSKFTGSSKERRDKDKKYSSACKVGIFEISPTFGTAESGETVVISIKCNPEEVKTYEERIIVLVSESRPHLKQGNLITISAESCLPAILFEDYKSVFREHYVCKTEAEFNSRVKAGSYTIFVEDDNLFSFKNVCVNKPAEARIHLPNASVIECHVTASVVPALHEDNKTSVSSTFSQFFQLQEDKLIIEPYNSGSLLIIFCPEALEVYKARLTITLEMPGNIDDVVRTYELWGNGVLPQIEITEPTTKLSEGQTLVNFPPIAPGNFSTSTIAFTNTGTLECKVILELYKYQDRIFLLIPKPETRKMMKMWDLVKPIDHTAIVSMYPGQTAVFDVTFNPQEVQTYQSQIKLFIVDNPYENWCFKLIGEVILEEVIFEKIRISPPFLVEYENEIRHSSDILCFQNQINFGDCSLKKSYKALLRLTNKTDTDYFKFEWEDVSNISISPSAGHLYPNSYKEILVTFQTEEAMELEEVPIGCTLFKILLENPCEPSWDTRLVQFQTPAKSDAFVSSQIGDKKISSAQMLSEGVQISGEEPSHEVVPEFNKVLYLFVSAIADYAKLNCEITKINFKNTFMFQNRVFPLSLENTGNITLSYELKLKSVTVKPLKEDKMIQATEKSILKLQQEKTRPRSSFRLSNLNQGTQESHQNLSSLTCDKRARPRPLTSASILDLKKISGECSESEDPMLEEQHEAKYNPFVIENVSGQIRPKEKAFCNVVFSPMDINEYKAVIAIRVPNLHPECDLPEIEVTASSIMPYCHFNVTESDYLESGRRDHSRPGPVGYAPGMPLHPDTKTIEIKVLGVGSTVPLKFYVINPTEEDYTFSWVNITQVQQKTIQSFHCTKPDGRIGAGRQQIMTFTFVSQKVGITESFWKFCIPKYEVETPFLFVGDVREASVYFLPNHINLKPTIIGASSVGDLSLVNNEENDFEFDFLPESFYSEGRLNALKVEPPSGKIFANSDIGIRVIFTGKTGGKTLFNLKCKVKTIQDPLCVTVEAVTYVVQPLLAFEDLKKVKHYPDSDKETLLDFGKELVPNRPETITLNMTSLTKPSFYYDWEYDKKILDKQFCKLKFSPKNGHVPSLSRGTCTVTLVFYRKSSLYNFPLKLKIRRGPTFNFLVNASASTPLCEFSFNSYDFGYCFLQDKDICYNETNLIIKNKENSDLVLEGFLQNSSAFSYSLPVTVIPSGEEISISIYFHPKECIHYTDAIKFTINGVQEKIVSLSGHGTDFKVTLSDPDDTTVSFGAVRVGNTCVRHFTLINRSLAPATLILGFSDQLPVHGSYLASPKENLIDLSEEHRLSGTIKISPSTPFRIKQQEKYKVSVAYTPWCRSSTFSETVCLQFQEKAEPICILTGCSLAPEILLDRTVLNFGAVVESCSNTMKVKLVNSGNIGARFEWHAEKLENYTIYPLSGYCSPESDVTIQVTFFPLAVQNCIKKKVECELFLSDHETYPSLYLNLIGDCIALPEAERTIYFHCFVRETDTKTIEIENSTGNEWHLVPLISGEYFKGIEAFLVPPLSFATFEVNYCPLTMTKGQSFHEGSVFFRFPNGKGLLYKFSGTALPPNAADVIEREVPCKTKYIELLKVRNWLQYRQRFKVNITPVENKDDPTCICTGLENLEVPKMTEKEYSLNFFTYNVGIQKFLVNFLNEDTREYIWYDITFKVVMCGPLEVITLNSGVRQTCSREIKLENPLMKTINYVLETTSPVIHFESESYKVPPQETVYATFSFTPIHPGDVTEKLIASCPELGEFPRELRLISVEGKPAPPRMFQTSLGTSSTEEFPIKNLSTLNATLHCRTTSEDFTVQETGSVPAGQTAIVKVTYEPSDLDSTTATLFVKSEQAGNFIFPLLGVCEKPLTKGPFLLKPGSGINIPFKNVFKKAKEFHMFVDNPGFLLKSAQEIIQPKEEFKIHVRLQKTKHLESMSENKDKGLELKFPVMGQLIVECFNPYIKWQFYLKGILEK